MITRSKLAAVGVAGTMMLALATPTLANSERTVVGPVGGVIAGAGAAVGGVIAGAGAAVGSVIDPHRWGPGYAYAPRHGYGPGYSAYAYGPGYHAGYSAYAYAPGPMAGERGDYVVSKDFSNQPIYQSQLSPFCNFGDKLNEKC